MRYNNKFFATKEEAKAFKKEHGGALYSGLPRSRTKSDFAAECLIALHYRNERIDLNKTPYCVAWNEINN